MKHFQQGLTLIELMVALLLGLIFSAAAFQLLFANQRTFELQQTIAMLQEDGQMAMRYITADIRNAGRGTILQGTIPPIVLNSDAPHGHSQDGTNDELVVQYFGTADCQGTPSLIEAEIINRYYVQNGALLCSGNLSTGAAELLNGVESFQVQYGLDTDKDTNLGVTLYTNASETMLDPSAAGADDAPVLVAVRLAVLLRSQELQHVPARASTYYLLDEEVTAPSDSRLRRVFSTTVHIRNYHSEEV